MAFNQLNKDIEIQKMLDSLDVSQRAAVQDNSPNVVIRAPAGSGKTKSLLSAVINYRYENLNDRICAITFTRAARAEMEGRLREVGIYDIEVTTIHVWARNQLEYFADLYDFKIQILEEPRIKAILSEIVRQYLIRSKIKAVNINILYTYITGNKNMDITDNYRRTLNALEERYIMYKRENGLYDFTDYPLYLYDILNTYNETIHTIDALFVDEFQDVDETQFQVFEKVEAHKKFYIGDLWQSIYQFRNADGKVFSKLKGFEEYKLKFNYRSYQEIIDYATTVYEALVDSVDVYESYIASVGYSLPSKIQCSRGYGGWVSVINPDGEGICWNNNCETTIEDQEAFDYIMQFNPMILCRTNKQVKAIQELGWNDVSTVHQAKGLEYDNVIVIDTTIQCGEDLNVAYVAMTRAKDRLLVINWAQGEYLLRKWKASEA